MWYIHVMQTLFMRFIIFVYIQSSKVTFKLELWFETKVLYFSSINAFQGPHNHRLWSSFPFMLADILPSASIAAVILVSSLSVHEKGHLWNNKLDESPWTSLCPQRLESTMTANETWGKWGQHIPRMTWFKLGLQCPLGRWSYFTASLRNGTNALASNITWLLRLKKDVNFTHFWHVGQFLPFIQAKSPSCAAKNKCCNFLEMSWWAPES